MLRVLHLTDTHVVAVEDAGDPPATFAGAVARVQGRSTTTSLRAVLDAVAAEGFVPDLVLHTGDAADDGDDASYAVLRTLLDEIGAPVLAVAGNHDRAPALAAALQQPSGPVHHRDLGGWRIVGVDTAAFERDHGELDPAALAAFDAVLAGAPGPTLVGLHHPPISVCAKPGCQLRQADAVRAAIERHPSVRAVVSGHLHVTDEIERDGTTYLLSPSTALQLRHEHPLPAHNKAPTPVGARLLELHDDGQVASRICWTG